MSRLALDARLLHYNRTGIGRYIRHLYQALAPVAPERDLTVGYSRKDREHALDPAWRRGTVLWTPPHHRLERWTLAAELLRLRPALVHAPDHVCPQPLGWRTVLTVHDLAFWRLPETHTPESRAYYDGLRRSAAQATRIICVSHATRQELLAEMPDLAHKCRVVYEAPDPLFLGPSEGPSTVATGRRYFVFVGTISPRKNVARIVEAFAAAVADAPSRERPELIMVGGDAPGAEDIRSMPAPLGVERDVRFVGHQPASEVARLYRAALALVYPSLMEGFGLPILEAMACGAPVITSNRSSMPEVAGEVALFVDPERVPEIAGAMRRALEDASLRDRLATAGRLRVTQFSWERAARETLAVFDDALGASSA
ncbi:MAG TPA: glycosyltransferase family 1 protein [Chloroflexota bacterium]|nr:glycosyltransferase family 1 protein [Chloroflexota bacterium]